MNDTDSRTDENYFDGLGCEFQRTQRAEENIDIGKSLKWVIDLLYQLMVH